MPWGQSLVHIFYFRFLSKASKVILEKHARDFHLKRSLSVISSDSLCEDDNALLFDQVWVRYQCKLIIFHWGYSAKSTCAFLLQGSVWELTEINTFKPKNPHS